jgi:hypothetical protein
LECHPVAHQRTFLSGDAVNINVCEEEKSNLKGAHRLEQLIAVSSELRIVR